MTERHILWLIAAGLLGIGVGCAIFFGMSDFSLVWMLMTVTFLVGSFMAFAVSFAAPNH